MRRDDSSTSSAPSNRPPRISSLVRLERSEIAIGASQAPVAALLPQPPGPGNLLDDEPSADGEIDDRRGDRGAFALPSSTSAAMARPDPARRRELRRCGIVGVAERDGLGPPVGVAHHLIDRRAYVPTIAPAAPQQAHDRSQAQDQAPAAAAPASDRPACERGLQRPAFLEDRGATATAPGGSSRSMVTASYGLRCAPRTMPSQRASERRRTDRWSRAGPRRTRRRRSAPARSRARRHRRWARSTRRRPRSRRARAAVANVRPWRPGLCRRSRIVPPADRPIGIPDLDAGHAAAGVLDCVVDGGVRRTAAPRRHAAARAVEPVVEAISRRDVAVDAVMPVSPKS